jgi:diaminopimelate epimerase
MAQMKTSKEMGEIASENAALDHETLNIEHQIESAAHCGNFHRVLILNSKEKHNLRELGYTVEYHHHHKMGKFQRFYYKVIW